MTNGSRARRWLSAAFVFGMSLLASGPHAQEAPAQPAAIAPAPGFDVRIEQTLAQLAATRERLREPLAAVSTGEAEAWLAASSAERLSERAAAEGLSENERSLWQTALGDEQAGAERIRGALNRAELALAAPTRLDGVEQRLGEMAAVLAAMVERSDRPLSTIDEDIDATELRRAAIVLEQDQRRSTLARLEEQLRGQDAAIEQLRSDRESLAAQDAAAANADPAVAAAREAAQMAAERRADAALIAARLDARSLPVRVEALELELETDALELAWIAERLAALQQEFMDGSTAALRELTTDLQRLVEREPDAEQRFAAELAQVRSRIDQADKTQARIGVLQLDSQTYVALERDLAATLDYVTQKLEVTRLNDALGTRFLQEQRRLRLLGGKLRLTAEDLDREHGQSRARSIDVGLGAAPAAVLPSVGVVDDSGSAELGSLQARVTAVLLESEEALTQQLAETGDRLQAVVALIDVLEQTLNEALLWWPSHAPVTLEWVRSAPAATAAVLEPSAWHATGAALREVTIGRAGTSLLLVVIAALLYRGGRRTGRRLRELADKTRHRFTDSIGLTYKALGWSVLRVLPIPMLLSATGFRLEHLQETDPGVEIIAAVLWSAAIWWLAGHLLGVLISRNGVATVHFEWNPVLLDRLRRIVRWYLPVQFVLIMCFALAFAHPEPVVFDVLGRMALIASGITVAVVVWRLLAPSAELGTAFVARRRPFLRIVLVTGAALLVGLALYGYLLTVSQLFERTIDTVVVLCLVGLGYRLATRALILSETRLRVRRMREQRAKAAAVESNSMSAETPDLPEPHLSIEDVNQQTRTLVRVAAGASMAAGLFWVWADMLPALTWLDSVTLWTRELSVNGDTEISLISLQDALLAAGLAVLLTLAARNLPGLVEIILSRTTKMDGAGRYTVATLLRYFITVIAVVTVFSLIGLRWAELQWMVAALTLGLGFGLQEVVANFVSGIIMLFERPVRVGDTITIGEYSGTVARIRTRATTIIDWDNREVVVPNKNFITERLINWTLSDTMTRIVLPLNISHDADPELVIDTLTRIAKAHPVVLADPAPAALLMKLGESALLFELRVYVSQLRDRLPATSDLHSEIIKKFRELDIKIAFPQLDLHVRDVPPRRGAQLLLHDLSGARAVPHAEPAASAESVTTRR